MNFNPAVPIEGFANRVLGDVSMSGKNYNEDGGTSAIQVTRV